jgi:hypothetical protein
MKARTIIVLFCAAQAAVSAQSFAKPQADAPGAARYSNSPSSSYSFPRMFFLGPQIPQGLAWARNENEPEPDSNAMPVLANNQILAYYGKPEAGNMGILGRFGKREIADQLAALAPSYDAANGDRGVKTAYYLIYGTVWPGGDIGILPESVTKSYIEYALERDMLVFLDHQIGRYTVEEAMAKLLPWLRYPNVHLALDPEWRTEKPMKEIGHVKASEINEAQLAMQSYLERQGLPGNRMLVVHQFKWFMIDERDAVNANYDRVMLVHCADGFGSPSLKVKSYRSNAEAANIPLKSFKLFYKSEFPKAGFDEPLLSPAEVCALDPFPYLVMYQ